ncbi:MAG: bifunctional phosphopantothenoylcysteine decarboxylase/phosphopantothenate--cysteine ligase CoaBC [Xanthomonadaceae bacterium]|nr:bifunctional phosphopantothenoylcysteine decarboxylase/phosphopantothenate--cysteine ligase CoaBC [Xanthomonadaceae bacterium]MDZ4116207.1 bifunctional phosphopantothenoylcysteine decarboxylase/phosphopantothenate--cysteine ligase CoaBC [Xanthomonadaceae bacterium]MDZ4377013.1 bifunctional phosphopantothenoylcysteine decarboxylase/phosphopantothenate--cysteine ligase CoaBC [Xanthomonadaceae bacterium]
MCLRDERVLLGVSGGIAAYKAAELVRRLRDAGAQVRVVMTEGAKRFITPLTLQALSGNPVRDSLWDEGAEAAMGHIELARWATRVLIAPATADTLARLAHGHANDLLSTLVLATAAPVVVAPAMNQQMWAHAATQHNVATLRGRGVQVFGPGSGDQACGEVGPGRLLEPSELVSLLAEQIRANALLAGARVLITAGPTFEDIDPVRFIGNRSSGKMGFAVAAAAAAMGAEVTLIAGPVALPTPASVKRIDVRSAAQMLAAVMAELAGQDIYIGAAAVADYTPACVADKKIKKTAADMAVALDRTTDILATVAATSPRPFVVGFAAETHDLEHYARDKLQRKGLDLIAANQVGCAGGGFEADCNTLQVFWADGARTLGPDSKTAVAQQLLGLIAERLTMANA